MQPTRPHRKACLFWPSTTSYCDVAWRPAADLYRTVRGWIVKLDLAGIDPQEVSVKIEGRRLRVQGTRHDYVVEEGCHYHSLEIAYSRFERDFEFPVDLGLAYVTTEYEKGMLLVRIQLGEEKP
jgi:HSP20 family protein